MGEINDYSTTASSNNSAAPGGWPEGMNPSDVNNSDRELTARLKRWYADTNGSLVTAGTASAYTVTLNSQHSAWFDGLRFSVRLDEACDATPTINPTGSDALGAKTMVFNDGTAIAEDDLAADVVLDLVYKSGTDKVHVLSLSGRPINNIVEDATPQLGADLDLNGQGIDLPSATVTDVTGVDTLVVSGTAGTEGNLVKWDVNGDAVDSGYGVLDEDDFASDSAADVPTQQSAKAYTDAKIVAGTTLTQNPIAAGATVTQAHGLGAEPNMPFECVLECLSADGSWSAGNRIRTYLSSTLGATASENNFVLWADATNVYVVTRNSAFLNLRMLNKSTRNDFDLTASKWKLEVTPFLLS